MLVEREGLMEGIEGGRSIDADDENSSNNNPLQKLGTAVTKLVLSEWEKWDTALLNVLSARLDDLVLEISQSHDLTEEKLEEVKTLLFVGETDASRVLTKRNRRKRFNECVLASTVLEGEVASLQSQVDSAASRQSTVSQIVKYGDAVRSRKTKGRQGVDGQRKFLVMKDLLSFSTTELGADRIAICVDGGTDLPVTYVAWKIDGEKGLARLESDYVDVESPRSPTAGTKLSMKLFGLLCKRPWLREGKLLGEHPAHELNDRLEQVCKIVGRMHLACMDVEMVFRGGENDVEIWVEGEDIYVKVTFVTAST